MIRIPTMVLPGLCEWQFVIDGMRAPMNSWKHSDTIGKGKNNYVEIGEKDLALMCRLIQAGTEHRKFLRMLHLKMEIMAPRYFIVELDTYKVGTTKSSCSTMHKVMAKEFSRDDFSMDGLQPNELDGIIAKLNTLRSLYLNATDNDLKKEYWRKVIMLLPQCYNQKFWFDCTYETALNMYFQRRHHKLSEWKTFCDELLTVPYFDKFVECLEEE